MWPHSLPLRLPLFVYLPSTMAAGGASLPLCITSSQVSYCHNSDDNFLFTDESLYFAFASILNLQLLRQCHTPPGWVTGFSQVTDWV